MTERQTQGIKFHPKPKYLSDEYQMILVIPSLLLLFRLFLRSLFRKGHNNERHQHHVGHTCRHCPRPDRGDAHTSDCEEQRQWQYYHCEGKNHKLVDHMSMSLVLKFSILKRQFSSLTEECLPWLFAPSISRRTQ